MLQCVIVMLSPPTLYELDLSPQAARSAGFFSPNLVDSAAFLLTRMGKRHLLCGHTVAEPQIKCRITKMRKLGVAIHRP
jgi:hypothetical protein